MLFRFWGLSRAVGDKSSSNCLLNRKMEEREIREPVGAYGLDREKAAWFWLDNLTARHSTIKWVLHIKLGDETKKTIASLQASPSLTLTHFPPWFFSLSLPFRACHADYSENRCPSYDQNSWRPPFGAAHTYMAQIREYPPPQAACHAYYCNAKLLPKSFCAVQLLLVYI